MVECLFTFVLLFIKFDKAAMKSILLISLSIFILFRPQEHFWPVIKGQWFVEVLNDKLLNYRRTPRTLHALNFLSKDSCQLSQIQVNDVYKNFRYKWDYHMDTIKIYRSTDTILFKVVNATSSELDLKPIF